MWMRITTDVDGGFGVYYNSLTVEWRSPKVFEFRGVGQPLCNIVWVNAAESIGVLAWFWLVTTRFAKPIRAENRGKT